MRLRSIIATAGAAILLLLAWLTPSVSMAETSRAAWRLDTIATPTRFPAKETSHEVSECEDRPTYNCDNYVLTATNVGAARTDGSPVVLTMKLPESLTPIHLQLNLKGRHVRPEDGNQEGQNVGSCEEASLTNGFLARCEYTGWAEPYECFVTPCKYSSVRPDEELQMIASVSVPEGTATQKLRVMGTVIGGGLPVVSQIVENEIGEPAPFGINQFSFFVANNAGQEDSQAGDHPYGLTVSYHLNNVYRVPPDTSKTNFTAPEDPKDFVVDLPLGFVGSTLAAPQCPLYDLDVEAGCPKDTQIGELVTEPARGDAVHSPLWNLVPEQGLAGEFGYESYSVKNAFVFKAHVVPTPKGYVLQTVSQDTPQISMDRIVARFYGNPGAKDAELEQQNLEEESGKSVPLQATHTPAFFTNPSDCTGEPVVATTYIDSWENPAKVLPNGTPVNLSEPGWVKAESVAPPVTGCDDLSFGPELGAQPTTHEADKPSGLEFEMKLFQSEESGIEGTPTLRNVKVTLPEGMTVDPSAGDGLAACSEAQIGYEEDAEGPLKFNAAQPQCPEASKIGSVELESPLIGHRLEGEMYLASQNENPFHTTLAAYVVVDDPVTGVLIKIDGEFLPDPHTGRLTTLFPENPNLPFSDLKLHFFGGPRAELATPEACGNYTTSSVLEPWSSPDSGPAASPFDTFAIDEACPGGFAPTFSALSTNVQAGAFTPVEVSFGRSDTDEELSGLSVTLPPGLLGKIAGVPLCGEAEANAGTCSEASRVGSVLASSGPGPNPLQVPGRVYLTGPYNGGPYGLSVVVPAVAGPYNFGTVVVRQSIRINPYTAQVSDVSDPFPKIIAGIPLRLRRIDVTLDRPGFTFNPTSCDKQTFNGTITGSPLGAPTSLTGDVGYATQAGATSPISAPFQVTDCPQLKFEPKFTVSTRGKTSRAGGASLTATLSYPNVPQGTEANIARVKVSLPKQLPSRLTTLQNACPAKQFEANPANCPAGSKIGYAMVTTPLLPVPLEGPAIFVSHGGEAFPSLTMVLQGSGVSVDLVGTTNISKAGITSTTFKAVPDVPFNTFTLTLPEGNYSALAANLPAKAHGSFCGQKLKMPTEFVAQNGAQIKASTKVAVSDCAKLKKASKKRRGKVKKKA
jgi:hypothetical protein